ncbi:MAG: hypothetical protein U1E26_01235 [Coriobacteriia bacterium]|nr:hypothetical protein [Coriobacteriia bacterium]
MPATVKGSVVTAAYDYLRATYGEEVWKRMLLRLSYEDQDLVKASSRTLAYPVAVDGRVLAAFVAEQFEGNRMLAERELRRGGSSQADTMLHGVFSIFARLASPKAAFSRAGSIITSVYTEVDSETEAHADGTGGIIRIHGLGESSFVAPWQCGWMERALVHFGSSSPRVIERAWQAGRDASDELVYEVTF